MNTDLQELQARLAQLERERRNDSAQMRRAERRARLSWACALSALAFTLLVNLRPAALAQAPGVTLASLQAAIVALQQKTAALTQTGTPGTGGARLTITGDNVQIVSGSGYTDDGTNGEKSGATLTGLGNLMIGYNGVSPDFSQARAGSHNLIIGDANNYSSYGGIVAGYDNAVGAPYATVTGGSRNLSSGYASSISGGYTNTITPNSVITADFCSISGGQSNVARGNASSVSGGSSNNALNYNAWVAGGFSNNATGNGAAVSGGNGNFARGDYSSVTGGVSNNASGQGASITGGSNNTAQGSRGGVSGGRNLTETVSYGWKAGSEATTDNTNQFYTTAIVNVQSP